MIQPHFGVTNVQQGVNVAPGRPVADNGVAVLAHPPPGVGAVFALNVFLAEGPDALVIIVCL